MPFRLIKGKFAPRLGRPDGDSVRFIPNKPSLLKGLKGKKVRIYTSQGVKSVQLRYEGIDTLEKGAIKPFSSDATRENMFAIGGTGSTTQDETLGFMLTRRIGPNRRPISFVYVGTTNKDDGAEVFVNETWGPSQCQLPFDSERFRLSDVLQHALRRVTERVNRRTESRA